MEKATPELRSCRSIRVHLGCGDEKLPGFINVDIRVTEATDYVADLNNLQIFSDNSVTCFYSHAFFEHLFRLQRLPHLAQAVRALEEPDGFCCYIGLPYFPMIARLYLEGGPGIVGESFNLFNVYRYTHGNPEMMPESWIEQLHKSLFDEAELGELLWRAGFNSFVMFNYCFVGEPRHPINIGFYATKSRKSIEQLRADSLFFLKDFSNKKIFL